MYEEMTEKKKRTRCPYFSALEKGHILEIVAKYKDIVECKQATAVLIKEKKEAWERITEEFNQLQGVTLRSELNLRYFWQNLKKKTKRVLIESSQTSDVTQKPSEEDEKANCEWMEKMVGIRRRPKELTTIYDSDEEPQPQFRLSQVENGDEDNGDPSNGDILEVLYTEGTQNELFTCSGTSSERCNGMENDDRSESRSEPEDINRNSDGKRVESLSRSCDAVHKAVDSFYALKKEALEEEHRAKMNAIYIEHEAKMELLEHKRRIATEYAREKHEGEMKLLDLKLKITQSSLNNCTNHVNKM